MSQKLKTEDTQVAVEEWADMIAQMQDSGKNPNGEKREQTMYESETKQDNGHRSPN